MLGLDGLWSDDAGLARNELGLTGNLFTGRRTLQGVDAEWTHGPLSLGGELLRGTFKPVDRLPAAAFTAQGWQLTASLFLVPTRLQAVVHREAFDPNRDVGGATFSSWLLGLNYFLKGDNLKFGVNYLHGEVPGAATDGCRLLTRVQVIF